MDILEYSEFSFFFLKKNLLTKKEKETDLFYNIISIELFPYPILNVCKCEKWVWGP